MKGYNEMGFPLGTLKDKPETFDSEKALHMTSDLKVTVGQSSNKGLKEGNEDSFGILIPDEPLVGTKGIAIALADGMSGCGAGKEASETCVKGFFTDYFSTPDSWSVRKSVQKVLAALNTWLYTEAQQKQESGYGLVSTLSLMVLKSTTAYLFHVGDSRIYRLRERTLEQLTRDHRVRMGEKQDYLNRAMGIDLNLDIDYRHFKVEKGDTFLLTTDGVHDFISDGEMARIAGSHKDDLSRATDLIVEKALARGSTDNLTCQIVRVDSLPMEEADEIYKKLTILPFPPELGEGMVIDGYRILRELHSSRRTQLYLALDVKTEEKIVLKTPSVNFEDDPAYIERFLLEEWSGKRINSPHVARIPEQKGKRRFLYFLLEYINGQTLREWIENNPSPPISEVVSLIREIEVGLRAFHRLDMLHQDLKPENIMIDKEGRIKIIDFGSVKIAGVAEISTPIERINLLGTVNYTAPEYLQGHPGSPASDIFSLGVIVYEMLTGKLPYGENRIKKMTSGDLRKLRYTPASLHNPMIPGWLNGTLKKAVHPDPRQRYGVLSEFLYDLTHPNPQFMEERPLPLMERDPLNFWRGAAAISFIINVLLLYFCLK